MSIKIFLNVYKTWQKINKNRWSGSSILFQHILLETFSHFNFLFCHLLEIQLPLNISELREIQFAIAKISGNGHSASVPGRQQRVEMTAEWKIHQKRGCLLWEVAAMECWAWAPGPLDFQENSGIQILCEISVFWNVCSKFLEKTTFCWLNKACLQVVSGPCTASLLPHFDT